MYTERCQVWISRFSCVWVLSCGRLVVAPATVPARLPCSWGVPGKDTAVGSHFLLQGIFLIQELNLVIRVLKTLFLSLWIRLFSMECLCKYTRGTEVCASCTPVAQDADPNSVTTRVPASPLGSTTDLYRQLSSAGGLAGWPGQSVCWATGHTVDLLTLKGSYQPRPLDGICCSISQLSLIIVTPCINFT